MYLKGKQMRPKKMESGFYALSLTHPLNIQVAEELASHGEFFFKSGKEVMDAFGLAFEKAESIQAIDAFLSFVKQLQHMDCHIKNLGFRWLDESTGKMALTYTIESTKFDNDSMWINEGFELHFPTKALVNHFARYWIDTEPNRQTEDFLTSLRMVADGR